MRRADDHERVCKKKKQENKKTNLWMLRRRQHKGHRHKGKEFNGARALFRQNAQTVGKAGTN